MIQKLIDYITVKEFFGVLLIFIALLIVASIRWGNRTFSVKTLNQMIFHSKVPMDGSDEGIYANWFMKTVPQCFIMTIIIVYIATHSMPEWFQEYFKTNIDNLGYLALVLSGLFAIYNYKIIDYIIDMIRKTDFYEKNYINPAQVNITFPKQKRNIIHIYLESMENTYLTKEAGGQQSQSYMPELEKLALENINISHNDKIGGSLTLEGTQWTIASMVGQEAGIPLLLPITADSYDNESNFLEGTYSLGEILQRHGYVNEFIKGSNSNFGCTSNFYKQHGNYKIFDYNSAVSSGKIPSDYFVFWGFEDAKLFEFAREELNELAKNQQPFNFVMETVDTHTPDGYFCPHCQNQFSEQYANVIACQSRQVNEFVKWCQQQPWYRDTTIVITGDHKSMSEKFFKHLDHDYIRTPYNCIINSGIEPGDYLKNRQFSILDMYPTMLAALGVKIEGEQLGLGVNLFSGKQTLIEKYGFDRVNSEIKKQSDFYRYYLVGETPKTRKKRKLQESRKNN